MKKAVVTILTVLMIITLFAGCSSNAEKIVGKWYGVKDISEAVNNKIVDGVDEIVKNIMSVDGVEVKRTVTYNEDGTYVDEVDRESFAQSYEVAKYKMKQRLIVACGGEDAVNSMLAATNSNLDTLIGSIFSEKNFESLAGETVKGKYLVEGNKLYLSKSMDEEIEMDSYIEISISGSTLSYKKAVGEGYEQKLNQSYKKEK